MKLPSPTTILLSSVVTLAFTACGPRKEQSAAASASPTAAAKASEPNLAAGKAVYARTCIACHQPNGLGVPGVFPPLYGNPILAEADPDKLIRIVLHGLQGPLEVKGKTYNSMMPAQGGLLKDHEIARVLTYVRDSWGEGAPPVTEQSVAKIRDTVQRATPWTWTELKQP